MSNKWRIPNNVYITTTTTSSIITIVNIGGSIVTIFVIDSITKIAFQDRLEKYRKLQKALNVNFKVEVVFEKSNDSSVYTNPAVYIYTQQHEVYAATSIEDLLSDVTKELAQNIQRFELTGSGFVVRNLVSLTANLWQLNPLRGST